MGVVYRAHDTSLGRDVALKVLRPGEHLFGDALARFRREAQSLARLHHRHIVTVHSIGDHEGSVYFTMDLVEGKTLADLISDGDLGTARSVKLLRQVASAIAYAHDRGIVHRDLKPHNILVDGAGDAYVVDFGLARDAAAGRPDQPTLKTATGQLLGTPAYMSPEQARGDAARIGEPSDIYALGAVLYECLVGQPPFGHRPVVDLLQAIVREEPTAPRRLNPKVPTALETVCLHALRKDPDRRYPAAQAFGEDLERFAEGRPIHAVPPGPIERSWMWLQRRGSHVITALIAILVSVACMQGLFRLQAGSPANPPARFEAEGDAHASKGEWSAARRT